MTLSVRTILLVMFVVMPATDAFGQPPPDSVDERSLDHGLRLLSGVRDHVYSFDDPAFYWFCRHVRDDEDVERYVAREGEPTTSWRFLMERPTDYRGQLVTIEGRLLRREAFEVPNREGVGRLYQCEIGQSGTRAVCTAVLTSDPGDIHVQTPVIVRGYFIKVRAFQTLDGQSGAGPLVVSQRLVQRGTVASAADTAPEVVADSLTTWIGVSTVVLLVVWIVIRRMLQRDRPTGLERPPSARISGAADDFNWLVDSPSNDQARRDNVDPP